MFPLKEALKEPQPTREEALAQRISEVTRQVQAWGKEAYKEAQESPEFVKREEIPGSPRRVRVCSEETPDSCTIVLPKSHQPTRPSIRLWTNFGHGREQYGLHLGSNRQSIEVFEMRRGTAYMVDSLVETVILGKARKIFELTSVTASLERKIYSGGSQVGLGTSWQTLKTETLSIL